MNHDIKASGFSVLILRITLSGIFISAGITHLLHPNKVVGRIENAAYSELAHFFGDPYTLGILTGYVLLIAGIMFLLGIFTRWSALILFIILIPISITIQMGNGLNHGPLWKNIALFGGLLFFILNNPRAYNLYNKY